MSPFFQNSLTIYTKLYVQKQLHSSSYKETNYQTKYFGENLKYNDIIHVVHQVMAVVITTLDVTGDRFS